MKGTCVRMIILIFLALLCLPFSSNQAFAATKAKVKATTLNIREKPTTASKTVGKLPQGAAVTIQGQQKEWAKISYGKAQSGWVDSTYLTLEKAKPAAKTKTGYATVNSLNVRQGASGTSKSLGKISKGTPVTVYSQNGSWLKVTVPSKKWTGWIAKNYIAFSPIPAAKPAVPAAPVPAATFYVTVNSLNLRELPTTSSKVIQSLNKGTAVQLTEKKTGWGKVKIANGKTGWVSLTYLSAKTPVEPVKIPTDGKYITLTSDNDLLKGPGTDYEVIKIEAAGTRLEKMSVKADWMEVKTAAGVIGWVHSSYIAPYKDNTDKPSGGQALAGKVIVLDPGHGGKDPGTSGKATGALPGSLEEKATLEKTVNLQTVNAMAKTLQAAGATVILTRTTDEYLTLLQRVNVSHSQNADVFISVHYNAPGNKSTGIDTFFYPTHVNEQKLASYVHEELIKSTQMKNRGVKPGNFQVIRDNKKPALLLELGFLSNPDEAKLVKSEEYQQKVAQGVYQGLAKYFSL
ncbi:hypothetical protein D0469_09870 [Peribacillus saganii]|uniref:SH3b domain-containing protein n=1 Tax=Peribacillus saganii TaxID=2303992 RepID=A0A372LPP8_9BACI|nr:N-acetylmuramoyl-L-alanine amidase [Peribacillus saganii]RFU69368.1 hypothetical protein D0469_09870 [Peribacillus saganii]